MSVKFGVCADLHTEYIHDALERFNVFHSACEKNNVDFCIQLGDFCPPGDMNYQQKEAILSVIENSKIPFYHVIGNHDTDRNTKKQVTDFYNIENPYYSFDFNNFHFVVIDACYYCQNSQYISYSNGNYQKATELDFIPVVSDTQLDWLSEDLKKAKYPTILFSHQSLVESRAGIKNADKLRRVLSFAKKGVIAAFCGHEHVDRMQKVEDVFYCCINSMSYYWAGSKYDHTTYGDNIESDYPFLRKVFPYKEPLYAIVEIDDKLIRIKGVSSEFVGELPSQIGFVKESLTDDIVPYVSNRIIEIK